MKRKLNFTKRKEIKPQLFMLCSLLGLKFPVFNLRPLFYYLNPLLSISIVNKSTQNIVWHF